MLGKERKVCRDRRRGDRAPEGKGGAERERPLPGSRPVNHAIISDGKNRSISLVRLQAPGSLNTS